MVSYVAVVAAAVASMVVGYVWYGPLFGKMWMKAVGITEREVKKMSSQQMGMMYGKMFVSSLVTAYVLSVFVGYAGARQVVDGAMVGFWAWLGFQATLLMGGVVFEKKTMEHFYVGAGYNLVNLLVAGAIVATVV